VSSTGQAEHGSGLQRQREVIERFCARERLKVVHWAVDPGVPGSTPLIARRGLTRALTMVRDGSADVLVVEKHDRLARDLLEALLIEREFVVAGGGVLYCEGANGADASMTLMRQVLFAVAEFDKRQLVTRLESARRAKAARGEYAGGRPPLGFEARAGSLYPKESEAEVVRWIFRRVADEGHSIRRIALALDRERTLDRRWRPSTVQTILARDLYKRGPIGNRIVDPKVFNRARAQLARRRKS
jgi:DNA invertase Pin-like site-specific DNA recombinase